MAVLMRHPPAREALGWSAAWVTLGLAFGVFVYFGYEYQWMGLGLAADAVDGQVNDGAAASCDQQRSSS
jgi:hypothetical protein